MTFIQHGGHWHQVGNGVRHRQLACAPVLQEKKSKMISLFKKSKIKIIILGLVIKQMNIKNKLKNWTKLNK